MCGIVGYYGKNTDVLDILLSGLKRLEYRGYDSAGIAALTTEGEVFITKESGKIVNLEKAINSQEIPKLKGLGIGHTRWATHGIPSRENSHPHFSNDENIYLIHNGIIENYHILKEELVSEGFSFYSQTDTEVVANLIQKYYKNDLREAVLKALSRITGAYALLIFAKSEPDRLIAAKKGSPLVLGLNENEFIFGSDVSPVISYTREVVYLEDGEIVDINNGEYKILNLANTQIQKQSQIVDWDEEMANKGGYEHFLLKEIMEQPKVIQDSIRGRLLPETAEIKFGGLIDVTEKLKHIERVVLLGVGTSYYSSRLGELYFESIAGVTTKAEMTPEFRYNDTVIDEKTWVIAISQSGETADTIAAIEEAKRKGALVTGIVNSVGSTISRITKAGVYNHIGPEISVASTKAFTSQSVLLLMHAILLGRMRKLGYSDGYELIKSIQELPDLIAETLKQEDKIKTLAEKYSKYNNFVYVGRKFNHPVALEGALKIKEISYIHAEGISAGEFKHGFIALIDENMPTLALVTKDSVYEKTVSNVQEIIARKGKILAVATEGDELIKNLVEDVIYVPATSREELQPLINNIVMQLFAYHSAVLRKVDVDKPRNLAKSVTVE
jgi:glucosamine--fructose-6-phosphate aminotransferase (isomerizing)